MKKVPAKPERYADQLAALTGFINRACAFTGHRPKKLPWRTDETAPGCVALKELLAAQIGALVEDGCTEFLSGMAEGTDYEKRKVMRSEILCALYENENQKNHFA